MRRADASLVMHSYGVIGVSGGRGVADVANLHGRRQGRQQQTATATPKDGREESNYVSALCTLPPSPGVAEET